MTCLSRRISPAHSEGFSVCQGKYLFLAGNEDFLQLSSGMGTGQEAALGSSRRVRDAAHGWDG